MGSNVVAAMVIAVLCLPAAANAQTGGTSPEAAPAPKRAAPALPPVRSKARLVRFACVTGCAAGGAVRPGSLLRLRGAKLKRTAEVDFLGIEGGADDVAAAPVKRRRTSVDVRVPLGAITGPVTILDRDGVAAAPVPVPLVVEAPSPGVQAAGGPSIDADVRAPKAFFDAARPMQVAYVVHDDRPVDVRVELVRGSDGAVAMTWTPGLVAPETPQVVQWDGLVDGRLQQSGRYSFRVTATDAGGALRASSAQAGEEPAVEPDPSAFVFLRHVFPVRGPHGYGEFAAQFGGGRGHQGQDVFAACGTPVVAARGGTVQFKQYHSRAGHYLVIDGERTAVDYSYMHLREAALVDQGDRVRTGQLLGYVGDTGAASGCHLHFEMWRGPGWYDGGSAFDPLPHLHAWDRRT
jgi:hypothetical protein